MLMTSISRLRPVMRFSLLVAVIVLPGLACSAGSAVAADALQIIPADIVLTGPEASQRLLVEHVSDGRFTGPVVAALRWTSSDETVVKVVDDRAVPVGDGTATVTAASDAGSASVAVTVQHFDQPHAWNFRNHVLAVFAKTGCNSGACHGALAGKGGFRLSLRGYSPDTDYHSIVKQARGRRVELSDPGRSLVLVKPSGGLPHKGGLRFDTDSMNYRVVSEWIAAGAAPPAADDPVVEKLEVLPTDVVLSVGRSQPLVVRAHYSDGHVEDVTRWTRFTSTNETVASVDADGTISVTGHGVGAITAWFASQIVMTRITSPFDHEITPDVYANAPRRNFIDELVLARLQDLRLQPSPDASDSEFIRRAFIDTIGTLPTADEVRSFLASDSPGKRDELIESLLGRPEFVDYWAYRWSDVLLVNGNLLRPAAVKAYYEWIRREVEQNTPWDELVRKVVTSTGSSVENGATNFYALHQDPENMAENVSQAFMGLSIGCARCHNHPLEKWTNNQYYAFANLFSRVRAKGWGGDFRSGDGVRTLYVASSGELIQPLTGRPQMPSPLDGEPIPFESTQDRRIKLADWLTSPANPYFTRAITNRIWASFFGTGLVEQVDDLRLSNPPSNDMLLTAASQFLIDHDYDLKSLMRVMLQSHTYQRSSQPLPDNRDDQQFYSRYFPRRLMAEVMLDAISQVTDVPTEFTHIAFPGGDRQETKDYPKGTRAIQLHDSAVDSYFLETFGRNARQITCECERSDEPSMVQVLHIANGNTINHKLKADEGRITRLLAASASSDDLLDEIFLMCLARRPSDKERTTLVAALAEIPANDPAQRRLLVEDIFWSLLSTREFLFNH